MDMAERSPVGCEHARTATNSQTESYQYAVRLHIATLLKASHFQAACQECHNSGVPLCCLDCDAILCPTHSDHEHPLACCLGSDTEGSLWCFVCKDFVCDAKFDDIKAKEIHRAMHALEPPSKAHVPNEATQKHMEIPFHAFSGLKGLVNMGATCYVSVVLQSLVHNPLVRAFFLGGGHQREICTRPSCLVCAVDKLYTDFFGSDSVAGYGITDLLVALAEKQPTLGAGSTEQDAHEFYLMLLNEFHSSHIPHTYSHGLANGKASHEISSGSNGDANGINGNAKAAANGSNSSSGVVNGSQKEANGAVIKSEGVFGVKSDDDALSCGCVAHRNFAGSIESTLKCECGKITHRREPMVDLGLDLGNATSTTLLSSLRRFTAAEKVANYTCDACGNENTTTKQLSIAQLPPVLLIQLKRFKHIGGTKGSMKVETPVDFPLQMDLTPFVSDSLRAKNNGRELVYELYGVISHTGTLDTGHYTCMMKHSSGQWYGFDDVTVTPVDIEAVKEAKRAYLLFYIVKWAA